MALRRGSIASVDSLPLHPDDCEHEAYWSQSGEVLNFETTSVSDKMDDHDHVSNDLCKVQLPSVDSSHVTTHDVFSSVASALVQGSIMTSETSSLQVASARNASPDVLETSTQTVNVNAKACNGDCSTNNAEASTSGAAQNTPQASHAQSYASFSGSNETGRSELEFASQQFSQSWQRQLEHPTARRICALVHKHLGTSGSSKFEIMLQYLNRMPLKSELAGENSEQNTSPAMGLTDDLSTVLQAAVQALSQWTDASNDQAKVFSDPDDSSNYIENLLPGGLAAVPLQSIRIRKLGNDAAVLFRSEDICAQHSLTPAKIQNFRQKRLQKYLGKAAEGRRNRRPAPRSFKGVTRKPDGSWVAQLKVNGKIKRLGRFTEAQEAARAYDRATLQVRGSRATFNFPSEQANAHLMAHRCLSMDVTATPAAEGYFGLIRGRKQPETALQSESTQNIPVQSSEGGTLLRLKADIVPSTDNIRWCGVCLDDDGVEFCEGCGCRVCFSCMDRESMICCSSCHCEYHGWCLAPALSVGSEIFRENEDWICPQCMETRHEETSDTGTSTCSTQNNKKTSIDEPQHTPHNNALQFDAQRLLVDDAGVALRDSGQKVSYDEDACELTSSEVNWDSKRRELEMFDACIPGKWCGCGLTRLQFQRLDRMIDCTLISTISIFYESLMASSCQSVQSETSLEFSDQLVKELVHRVIPRPGDALPVSSAMLLSMLNVGISQCSPCIPISIHHFGINSDHAFPSKALTTVLGSLQAALYEGALIITRLWDPIKYLLWGDMTANRSDMELQSSQTDLSTTLKAIASNGTLEWISTFPSCCTSCGEYISPEPIASDDSTQSRNDTINTSFCSGSGTQTQQCPSAMRQESDLMLYDSENDRPGPRKSKRISSNGKRNTVSSSGQWGTSTSNQYKYSALHHSKHHNDDVNEIDRVISSAVDTSTCDAVGSISEMVCDSFGIGAILNDHIEQAFNRLEKTMYNVQDQACMLESPSATNRRALVPPPDVAPLSSTRKTPTTLKLVSDSNVPSTTRKQASTDFVSFMPPSLRSSLPSYNWTESAFEDTLSKILDGNNSVDMNMQTMSPHMVPCSPGFRTTTPASTPVYATERRREKRGRHSYNSATDASPSSSVYSPKRRRAVASLRKPCTIGSAFNTPAQSPGIYPDENLRQRAHILRIAAAHHRLELAEAYNYAANHVCNYLESYENSKCQTVGSDTCSHEADSSITDSAPINPSSSVPRATGVTDANDTKSTSQSMTDTRCTLYMPPQQRFSVLDVLSEHYPEDISVLNTLNEHTPLESLSIEGMSTNHDDRFAPADLAVRAALGAIPSSNVACSTNVVARVGGISRHFGTKPIFALTPRFGTNIESFLSKRRSKEMQVFVREIVESISENAMYTPAQLESLACSLVEACEQGLLTLRQVTTTSVLKRYVELYAARCFNLSNGTEPSKLLNTISKSSKTVKETLSSVASKRNDNNEKDKTVSEKQIMEIIPAVPCQNVSKGFRRFNEALASYQFLLHEAETSSDKKETVSSKPNNKYDSMNTSDPDCIAVERAILTVIGTLNGETSKPQAKETSKHNVIFETFSNYRMFLTSLQSAVSIA